jgi:endoglucanase
MNAAMRIIFMIFILTIFYSSGFAKPRKISKFIKIDQFGYMTQMKKVAVIVNPQNRFDKDYFYPFSPGEIYQVRDFNSDKVVHEGKVKIWNNGNTHENSGDKGWWFDFSKVTTPGSYYIFDTKNAVGSYPFDINDNVYDEVLKAAVRMFYFNRCNFSKEEKYTGSKNWVDGPSFSGPGQDKQCRSVLDPNNPATERDLSGGWWDAGDFNKYTTFTQGTLSDLLNAYSNNPTLFGDNYNIPESGNGIPDLLDEIKYEFDFLMKMQNQDGSGIIKMGNLNQNDPVKASLPPSTDKRKRYYYPQKSTAAAIGLARVFGHGAYVFQNVPALKSYADDLKRRAILSFEWFEKTEKNDNIDNGTIQAGDADKSVKDQMKLYASTAIYLYGLTGEQKYNDIAAKNYTFADVTQSWWGPYDKDNSDALLAYTKMPGADKEAVKNIYQLKDNSMNSAGANASYNFLGFRENDCLYRAFMPSSAYHWGSNFIASQQANINLDYILYNRLPEKHDEAMEKATGMINYLHGVNPLTLVYLTNMYKYGAENSVNEMYHTWFYDETDWDNAKTSKYGPPPGYLTGGPNKDFSLDACCQDKTNRCGDKSLLCDRDMSMLLNQPPMKSYLDYNASWPLNSWAITEPAIYYQAAYINALSTIISWYKGK